VPCSNSGVLAKRPEARHRLNERSFLGLETIQKSLLNRGFDWLRSAPPGARLVYATCSILPRENSGLVGQVLAQRSEFELEAEISETPLSDSEDGGYAARIVVKSGPVG